MPEPDPKPRSNDVTEVSTGADHVSKDSNSQSDDETLVSTDANLLSSDVTELSNELTQSISEFREALEAGEAPDPEAYVRGDDEDTRTETLRDLVAIEMELRWKDWLAQRGAVTETDTSATMVQGDVSSPLLEGYLQRYPLLKQTNHLKWLVSKEIEVRTEFGDSIVDDEYQTRFPDLAFNDTSLTGLRTKAQGGSSPKSALLKRSNDLDLDKPFGPYLLLKKIGAGGMGLVYKARQVSADRIVALKILRLDRVQTSASSSGFLDRFQTEARATSRIDHPGIVTVFDVGEFDGLPYYAMKFVDGENLDQIHSKEKMSQREAARVILDAARALQAAHNCGVLHRDLKPQNILIERGNGQVCLADFGLAKFLETDQSQTREGDILGTPGYMSPEQARDSGSVTTLADVYGLGASLYYLLTGQPPFTGSSALQILRQVVDEPVKPPTSIEPAVDSDLELICLKSIEKEPEKRYSSAANFADDLERWLKGEPILARPVGKLERVYSWCKRNPFSTTLIALTACSLMTSAIVSYLGYREVSHALTESEESYRQARETVNGFFTTVSEDILLNQPSMQPLRRELLDKALRYYRGFLNKRGQDATLQREIAETYYRIGRIEELIENCESAQKSFDGAEQLQRALLSQSPGDRDLTISLSQTLAERVKCFSAQGNLRAAMVKMEESYSLRKGLVESDPDDLEAIRLLANAEMNLAILHVHGGDLDLAREEYLASLDRRRPYLASGDHLDEDLLRDQGMCFYNLANLEVDADRMDRAAPAVAEAILLFEKCRRTSPDDFEIRKRLGFAYRLQGEIMSSELNLDGAVTAYAQASEVLDALLLENPRVLPLREAVGTVELHRGELYYELYHQNEDQALENALTAFDRAIAHLGVLSGKNMPDSQLSLARARYGRSVILVELGDLAEARTEVEKCIHLIQELQTITPDNELTGTYLQDQLAVLLQDSQAMLEKLPAADTLRKEF